MSRIVLITGGTRSGKSRIAEDLVLACGDRPGYIATALSADGEMEERIARHRERRGSLWRTYEEPLALAETIASASSECTALLVDCVTLWVTNLMLRGEEPDAAGAVAEARRLTSIFSRLETPLFLVTNEVGMGIVPENRLARMFRDAAGEVNQLLAAAADEVYLAVSGIPMKLKG